MMPNTFKRFLCAAMALLMLVALLPAGVITAEAATGTVIDAAVFFSDLHTSKSNYKQSTINDVFGAVKNTGLPVSSITSCGDAFSVNESSGRYDGDISKINGYIQNVLGNVPVNYVWSDHDRYAKINGSYLDSECGFIYGVNDASANYYVYELSMAYLSTDDRYNTGVISTSTTKVNQAIEVFKTTARTLDKTKPLFIASHQPLLDRRNDNGHALLWANAINEVAEEMDVVFLSGHNHRHDAAEDYYYEKGSTMPVCSSSSGAATDVTLNFTHLTAGYLEPTSTNSYNSNTRLGCLIVASITDDSIILNTYNKNGIYTGNFAVNTTVERDCAGSDSETEETEHQHTYASTVFEPTCNTSGYTLYTCTVCDDSYYADEVDPAHVYTSVITPPTADAEGFTTHTCQLCGDIVVDTYVPALGHKYEGRVQAPTCTAIGYTVYTCTDCGHRYLDNYVSALGHDHEEADVHAPTCTENGYTLYSCSRCDDSYQGNIVNALGHNNTEVVTAPTCTENGYTTFSCTTCGEVTVGSFVPMANHVYDCVRSDNLLVYTCQLCGHSYSVVEEPEYTYNKITKLANNSNYVITLYYNKQYYALSHSNNKISITPIAVANNKIVSDITEDLLWTYNNKALTYKTNGLTYKLNASSTRLSISASTSATIAYSGSKLKVGTNYLRYASNTVTLNRTATTTYLFNQVQN